MAITRAQLKALVNGFGANPFSAAFDSNVVAGNIGVAVWRWATTTGNGTATITDVQDSQGGTWVVCAPSLADQTGVSDYDHFYTQMAYCLNLLSSAAETVTVTWSASPNVTHVTLYELTPGVFDQATSALGSGTSVSAGTITTVAGSYAITSVVQRGSGGVVFTEGNDWTPDANTGGGAMSWIAESAETAAGSITGDCSSVQSTEWGASIISFKPSGGGPTPLTVTVKETQTTVFSS